MLRINQLIGFGALRAVAAELSDFAWVEEQSSSSALSSYSFSGCNFGSASSSRVVILFIAATDSSGNDGLVTSVSINGAAAFLEYLPAATGLNWAFATAEVPSEGSPNSIDVVFNGTQTLCSVNVYRALGYNTRKYSYAVSGGAGDRALTIPVAANSAVLAGMKTVNTFVGWTGVTQDNYNGTQNTSVASSEEVSANSAFSVSLDVTGGGQTWLPAVTFRKAGTPFVVGHTLPVYATSTSQNITIPSAVEIDDLLIVSVMHRDTLTPPSGWTLVDTETCTGASFTQYQSVYKRTAQSGDASSSITWTQATSVRMSTAIMAFRSTAGLLDALTSATAFQTNDTTSSNVWDMASVTGTADSQMVLTATSSVLTTNSITLSSGWVGYHNTSIADNRMGIAVRALENAESSSGTFTSGVSGSSNNGVVSVAVLIG